MPAYGRRDYGRCTPTTVWRIFSVANTLGTQAIEPDEQQVIDIGDGHPMRRVTSVFFGFPVGAPWIVTKSGRRRIAGRVMSGN